MAVNTYGDFPGVKARVIGGGINGVIIGVEQKLLLVGRGDTSGSDSANYNEPVEVKTQSDAQTAFGTDTRLTHACQKALANGANSDYVYGMMPREITVENETVTGGSGTLQFGPVIEDTNLITVTRTDTSTEVNVELRFEEAITTPTDGAVINPNTRQFEGQTDDTDTAIDYTVSYPYLDWDEALSNADPVFNHNETGVLCTLSDSTEVSQQCETKVNDLRPDYKLIRGVVAAQPNDTSSDGQAIFDSSTYTNPIDNDSMFMAAPVRLDGQGPRSVLGGIAGHFAGNELIDPVFTDILFGFDSLNQEFSKSEEENIRTQRVIPVRDSSLDGELDIRLQDNISTSSATEWKRDYHRRRVVDQVLLIGRSIGEQAVGLVISDELLGLVESQITTELRRLSEANVIRANPTQEGADDNSIEAQQQKKYVVNATQPSPDTIAIEIGITPTGVVKRVDETIIVSDE